MKESDIQKSILQWLEIKQYCHWRNFVGPVVHRGNNFAKNPMAGLPDIIGVMKNRPGVMFAIEVKAEDGRLSDKQKEWLGDLTKAGVLAFVAYDLQTVIDALEEHDV